MIWYRSISISEYVLIGLFIVLYSVYIFKLFRVSRQLHTPFGAVFIKFFIRTIAFVLIVIAILGPSFGSAKKEVKSVGKDIMICVDLSKSMDAFDIQPSRLEKIKFEMKRIVNAFNSDRVGVIIFSSEAFMQCPLTFDQNALNLFIETMNTGLVPGGGTDFGPPLQMALKKLSDAENSITQPKSKVIILISDGEDFGEETDDALSEVEQNNIKLFTLGIGTEKGGNIATGNGIKLDKSGQAVVTKLNSSSLKELAQKTGGQYHEINEERNDVPRLIQAVSKIEGQFRDARTIDVSANKYFYFLLAALVLLVADVLINIRTVRI
ncbi:MAG: VWA domain-containing protein [Cyclobacteriaceae bacterium]|nr:VWA domain-containing protein [Cyclobacteriaceae bacterium]